MEASSLAGLSFISSSKFLWSRSLWIIAVILSVFLALYQIDSTFKSWDKNPVYIDIQVLPISAVKLPGITVCPPKGSHTGLNYDLIRARNITLDYKDRQEMINYAVDQIIDKEAEVYKDYLERFLEKERPRNWLNGISHLALPGTSQYSFQTSALSGSISTPSFGKKFYRGDFLNDLIYKFWIEPEFWTKYRNTFFVIDLTFYLLYYDIERIQIGFWGEPNKEKLSGTGTIRKKYPVKNLGIGLEITVTRSFSESDISALVDKTMTGFHAEWHIENSNETIMNVSQQPSFITWGRNNLFREFMSLVKRSVSSANMAVGSVMERFKYLKKEWILRNREKINDKCTYYDIISDFYMSATYEKNGFVLKIEEVEQILSEYANETKVYDSATDIRKGQLNR